MNKDGHLIVMVDLRIMKGLEQEFEQLSLDNYKLRRMLIEEENELIHITMGKDKWKIFVEWLGNKRKHEKS